MKQDLKKEFQKVRRLSPTKYIIVTSLELSPFDKSYIMGISGGLIVSESDIIGNEDLNNLLGTHPEIEKKHYKLWLSSINILESIFHEEIYSIFNNSIIESSRNKIHEIQLLLPKLVRTRQYDDAYKILAKNNIIFITGEAGCGKSSMSELLFSDLCSQDYQGWFSNDLSEFTNILNTDKNKVKKEVYFWDDIFGQTYFQLDRGFDTRVIQFIKSIKRNKNKYLIINSRTAIFNAAKNHSEKLRREEAFDLNTYQLKIDDYSDIEKAIILYNHCILNLDCTYFEKIKKDKFYFKIINHDNFSPRLIDFITKQKNIKHLRIENNNYTAWIIENLDNPEEVWIDYFDNLSSWAKDYLKICYTFRKKKQCNIDECFSKMLCIRSFKQTDLKRKAVDELTNSFLKIYYSDGSYYYKYYNPSIEDFLTNYFNRNTNELIEILNNSIYLEQFEFLDNTNLFHLLMNKPTLQITDEFKRQCYNHLIQNENIVKVQDGKKTSSCLEYYKNYQFKLTLK